MVFCQAVWYTQTSEHAKRIVMKGRVIMGYGWATVFTLAAWFAGLVLDANVTFLGDLGLRAVLPIIVMGCCIMKHTKDCHSK